GAQQTPAREHQCDENREARSDREPAESLLECEPPSVPELVAVVPEGRRDRGRLRQQELLHVECDDECLPGGDAADKDDRGGEPVEEVAADEPPHPSPRV